MTGTYPNPWDFDNTGKALASIDNTHRVVYYQLNEVAMGAPIGGRCFLETIGKEKIQIHNWCGGPPAWETNGQLVAIPIWSRRFLKGTIQQIGIVDINTMELKIFAKTFEVLDLRSFDKKIIYGYDSPMYNPVTVIFDIEKEKIGKVIKLVK